eukprot:CAMPEP_0194268934 /NCGR_PEP_ID=MMETSP0169-20130528/3190_1 /TAXON_ID=218684 /ORGANISM="Corethron pennatum, Strain L29A3" /LENGTH=170 /DNA_ID=CAMNT_0039010391 /DNA_START=199 /DNA_END=707 /DNA_ORIENTATION=+
MSTAISEQHEVKSRSISEKPCLTTDEVEEIREAFNLFDTDGSGKIDPKELKDAMQSLGFDAKNQSVYRMIDGLDKEGKGSIEFDEFLDVMTANLPKNTESREDVQKIFNLFDEDNRGTITFHKLKRVADELGENMTDAELQEMIDRADSDKDGEINFEDFYSIMTKKTFV